MDEAAPQAAGGTGTEDIAKVLDVLRLLWDDEYLIGHDDDFGWWASRRGVVGHIITCVASHASWGADMIIPSGLAAAPGIALADVEHAAAAGSAD